MNPRRALIPSLAAALVLAPPASALTAQPGHFRELLGGYVAQFYALNTTIPVSGTWGSDPTKVWAKLLSTAGADTQALMRYRKTPLSWLDDAKVHPEFGTLPPGVDLYILSDAHHDVWTLINFDAAPQIVPSPQPSPTPSPPRPPRPRAL